MVGNRQTERRKPHAAPRRAAELKERALVLAALQADDGRSGELSKEGPASPAGAPGLEATVLALREWDRLTNVGGSTSGGWRSLRRSHRGGDPHSDETCPLRQVAQLQLRRRACRADLSTRSSATSI
ncbi:hypothetical protein [Alienimonas californiensis]|uniref:Uncharacterized protein n=1 Tax=Alienimonas californiensis TaxID=2527989 RepID=A0A517PE09_9PLAN|nr:hypothetical protein [Alienimonas californiensis]QDT17612.1 hypothetical protein CA12_37400 [Alienimonas californiensis]